MIQESTVDGTLDAFKTIVDSAPAPKDIGQGSVNQQLSIPNSVVDFVMDKYGFFNPVEAAMLSVYVMQTFGKMENDGFSISITRTHKDGDGKYILETYPINIDDMVALLRIRLALQLSKGKNEKDSL